MQQESFSFVEDEKPYVKGTHLVTIFHNDANLYSVVRIRIADTNLDYHEKEIVVTGYFPIIHEEELYTFYGQLKEHPRFGLQFHITTFQKEIPVSEEGIVAYLSGSLFKGIGKAIATSVVDTLGTNTISQILQNPTVLQTVPKLTKEKARIISETLKANQGLDHVMIGLNDFGFGSQLSMKIFQVYKEEAIELISENPYRLIEDIEGIGFARADEIGRQLGFQEFHPSRIKAAILFVLDRISMQEGHTYVEVSELLTNVEELLFRGQSEEIDFQKISEQLLYLEEEGKVVGEQLRAFLPSLFFAEKGIDSHVKRILAQEGFADQFPHSEFLLQLGELETRLQISYAEEQREAIYQALHSPMLILTGGPGTGKTTVIKGIVELYAELHGLSLHRHAYQDEPFPFVLAAPTGRAAKRMSEATNLPAMTIHRLLGWNGQDGFAHDDENPVEGRLFVIDESSMIDCWLMNQLLKSIPEGAQIVFVGDEDQLPSVGPGQVLKDFIASGVIPVARLQTIFRQEEGSSIIQLAHAFRNGNLPENLYEQQEDRSFFPCQTDQVAEVIRQIAGSAQKKGYLAQDIQVLAPMYRGAAGVDALNKMLQEVFNENPLKKKREILFGDVIYRVGDKVLQLLNRPEDGVFNGDMGEIISISFAKENDDRQDQLYISFDGIEVMYTRQDLIQITHAFCCSIHKAQGSEFPIVILPIVRSYFRMLRRNLVYTAITRSKQFLILCGEEEALIYAAKHSGDIRKTMLLERLTGREKSAEINLQNSIDFVQKRSYEEELFAADPMVGMENISPYNF